MLAGRLREAMKGQQNPAGLLVICTATVVLSILGIVGALSTRLLGSLDGLLMLAVCLMMVLIFAFLLYVLAREQGWFGKREHDGVATPPSGAGK